MYGHVERIGLFIDAANFAHLTKRINLQVDMQRLRNHFNNGRRSVVFAGFYTAIFEDDNGRQEIRPLLDWLGDRDWSLVTKEARMFGGQVKGNMDIDIAVHVLQMSERLDHVILGTGDGDFVPLVRALQAKGLRVSVLTSRRGNMLSNALKHCVCEIIDLMDIQENVRRVYDVT